MTIEKKNNKIYVKLIWANKKEFYEYGYALKEKYGYIPYEELKKFKPEFTTKEVNKLRKIFLKISHSIRVIFGKLFKVRKSD